MFIKIIGLSLIIFFIIKNYKKQENNDEKNDNEKNDDKKNNNKRKKVSFNDEVTIYKIPNLTNYTSKDNLWYNASDYNNFVRNSQY